MKKNGGGFCRFRGTITTLIILVVLFACYLFGPVRFCYVPSGSMEPNLPTWSFCIVSVWAPYEKLAEGDIIVYNRISDGLRIVHRVIAVTDEGIVTKGDANRIDDGLSVNQFNYYGKYLFHIPMLGKVIALSRTPVGIVISGAVILAILLWLISDDVRQGKKEKKQTPLQAEDGAETAQTPQKEQGT